MKIRAVIVEDSRLARNELKELIKLHDDLELIGEAGNVDDGVALIETESPDLLFLDINMPEKMVLIYWKCWTRSRLLFYYCIR